MVSCFLPSGVGMVPTLPVTPSAAGASEPASTGGQAAMQEPVQALVPESLVSLAKR